MVRRGRSPTNRFLPIPRVRSRKAFSPPRLRGFAAGRVLLRQMKKADRDCVAGPGWPCMSAATPGQRRFLLVARALQLTTPPPERSRLLQPRSHSLLREIRSRAQEVRVSGGRRQGRVLLRPAVFSSFAHRDQVYTGSREEPGSQMNVAPKSVLRRPAGHNDRLHLPIALVTPPACASVAPSRGCAPDAFAGEACVRG